MELRMMIMLYIGGQMEKFILGHLEMDIWKAMEN